MDSRSLGIFTLPDLRIRLFYFDVKSRIFHVSKIFQSAYFEGIEDSICLNQPSRLSDRENQSTDTTLNHFVLNALSRAGV